MPIEDNVVENYVAAYYRQYLFCQRDLDIFLLDSDIMDEDPNCLLQNSINLFDSRLVKPTTSDLKVDAIALVAFAGEFLEIYFKDYRTGHMTYKMLQQKTEHLKNEVSLLRTSRTNYNQFRKQEALMLDQDGLNVGLMKSLFLDLRDKRKIFVSIVKEIGDLNHVSCKSAIFGYKKFNDQVKSDIALYVKTPDDEINNKKFDATKIQIVSELTLAEEIFRAYQCCKRRWTTYGEFMDVIDELILQVEYWDELEEDIMNSALAKIVGAEKGVRLGRTATLSCM